MRALVAVSDTGGFSAAARRMALSPSAITRLVASLERSLGVQLLLRSTRSVRPTRAGEAYLEHARRTLEHASAAERAAKAEQKHLSGTLRIAAPLLFGRLHAGRVLAEFMTAHPDVRIEMFLANDFSRLIDDGIDVAVRIGALPDSSLLGRSLGQTQVDLVASPAYLASSGVPGSLHDLARHRLIGFAGVTARRAWNFSVDGAPLSMDVDPIFYGNNAESAIALAVEGGGIANVLRYQVADHLRTGSLVPVLSAVAPPPIPIHVVVPDTRFITLSVCALLDHLVAHRGSWQADS